MKTATVQQKNNESWQREVEQLFLEHYDFLYRTAKAVFGCPAYAEDVVQTLFLKLVQHELRPGLKANPKAYLHRAAVNQALDMMRSQHRRKEDDGAEQLDVPDVATGRVNDNVRTKLWDTFTKIKPHVVEILILHYKDGYSDAEIAEIRGESRGKIAMILNRMRSRLRKAVGLEKEMNNVQT